MKHLKYWIVYRRTLILFSCLSFMAGCISVGKPQVRFVETVVTEYPTIPNELKVPVGAPKRAVEPTTIENALTIGAMLRSQYCLLRGQYHELMRHATGGKVVLKKVSREICSKYTGDGG